MSLNFKKAFLGALISLAVIAPQVLAIAPVTTTLGYTATVTSSMSLWLESATGTGLPVAGVNFGTVDGIGTFAPSGDTTSVKLIQTGNTSLVDRTAITPATGASTTLGNGYMNGAYYVAPSINVRPRISSGTVSPTATITVAQTVGTNIYFDTTGTPFETAANVNVVGTGTPSNLATGLANNTAVPFNMALKVLPTTASGVISGTLTFTATTTAI